MYKFNKLYKYLYIFVSIIILVVALTNYHWYNNDIRFLYNRVLQMHQCIMDGNIPFFYYNDFNNMGYGSSFYYGYLLLYLVALLPSIGFNMFARYYTFIFIFLTIIGIVYFFRLFTENFYLYSFLYLSLNLTISSLTWSPLYSMLMAQALSLFFFAFCVNFFRDNKNFIPASLCFWLILNTHMLSSLVSFCFCVCIFIYYFDKKRLFDYVKFALFTCLICSYNILNYIYHKDCISNIANINKSFKGEAEFSMWLHIQSYLGYVFSITKSILDANYFHHFIIFSPIFLILLIICYKRLDYNKYKVLGMFSIFLLFISSGYIFERTFLITLFQFPSRYLYIIFLVLILILKKCKLNKFLIFCLVYLGCLNLVLGAFYSYNDIEHFSVTDDDIIDDLNSWSKLQIINGEYLSKDFDMESFDNLQYPASHIIALNSENTYDYIEDRQYIFVTIKDNTDNLVLQFPKLWYNGYKLEDQDGNFYNVYSGYSQFCTANLGVFNGTLKLYYKHPTWLIILDFICYIIIFISLLYYLRQHKKDSD